MRVRMIILWSVLWLLPLVAHAEVKRDSLFDWSASATFTSNYIWRGLYVGGPSIHADATVSYAGVFANMWWNIGATDWAFSGFNPEVDLTIGFSRWGLTVLYMHIFYFDKYPDGTPSRFFDFRNHAPGGGGTTGEWRVAYQHPVFVSAKGLQTSVNALCAFRTFGRDGYYELIEHPKMPRAFSGTPLRGEGDEVTGEMVLKRAYSTYIELGVDQGFERDWMLAARVGFTPAKSLYTGYQGDFAVTLVGLKLSKSWNLGERREGDEAMRRKGVVNVFAQVMLQPWQVNKNNLILPITQAGGQKLNLAVGCSYNI